MFCRRLIPLVLLLALGMVPRAEAGRPHARPGWMVGIGPGYELRVTSTFAASLAITANGQDIGEYFIDQASFGSAALVANWYFH